MDSRVGDDERTGPMIASQVRKWTLKAAEHEEAARKARARKEHEQAKWINAPVELFRKLTAVHDWEIAHHEEQARTYRRHAAIAARDCLLDLPEERPDTQHQHDHGGSIGKVRRTGRVRQTQDSSAGSSG
jgi:hypothetical protein